MRVGRVAAPLRSQALVVLRQAILDFHYRPSQRLIERGMIVASPSLQEAREVYEVRHALEELAMRAFIERASDAQVAGLRAALDRFESEAGGGGDLGALLRSKDDAYEVVLAGGQNEVVRAITEGLRARVRALDAAVAAVHAHVDAARTTGLAALEALDASGT